jgi:hypothetical protein
MILTGVDQDILSDQLKLTNNRLSTALEEIIKRQLSLALSMENGTALPCLCKSYKGQPIWMDGFFCRYSRETYFGSFLSAQMLSENCNCLLLVAAPLA